MAKRHKSTGVVDGFTTLKAAERAKAAPRPPPVAESPVAEKSPPAPPPEPLFRPDKTARPSRHDIICYECGFTFFLTGALKSTYCPKCRCILDAEEQRIDNDWSGNLKTIGTVVIGANGCLRDGSIVAGNIVLEGKIAGGRVKAWGRLEIGPGGNYRPEFVDARDYAIRQGGLLKAPEKMTVRNMEIAGEFEGELESSGVVTVKPGGMLRGRLTGRSLVVEDGGGMDAFVDVGPREPVSMPAPGGERTDNSRRIGA